MLDKNREVARKNGIALRHTNPLNLKTRIKSLAGTIETFQITKF